MGNQSCFVIEKDSEFDILNSNFPFTWRGEQWRNVFQAYQATKFLCSGRKGAHEVAKQICSVTNNEEVARLVKKNERKVASKWDLNKMTFMAAFSLAQIKQNPALEEILLSSGDHRDRIRKKRGSNRAASCYFVI